MEAFQPARPRKSLSPKAFPSQLVSRWSSDPLKLHFLQVYHKRRAKFYQAAGNCGNGPDTVKKWMAQDPEFASAVRFIQQSWADLLEDGLEDEPGPVGKIVRLKALRPAEYIERQAILQLAVNASEVPPEQWQALLRAIATDTMAETRVRFGMAEPDASLTHAGRELAAQLLSDPARPVQPADPAP